MTGRHECHHHLCCLRWRRWQWPIQMGRIMGSTGVRRTVCLGCTHDDHSICNKNLVEISRKWKCQSTRNLHAGGYGCPWQLSHRSSSHPHSFSLLPAMSRPASLGHGVAYDPVPNPQELSDTPLSLYESAIEQPSPGPSTPVPEMSDLNPDETSVNLVPPPRFLGTINGEGLRESVGSFSSRARSEGFSSLYA